MSMSIKQKLNTKSSTEAELVGVVDITPHILWTSYFLDAQGYHVQDTIVYQDNKSAILLEKNGRASSSKHTKHINARYFFIKDHIESGEMNLKWCNTDEMMGDFFTKPMQGKKFLKFCKAIMNTSY